MSHVSSPEKDRLSPGYVIAWSILGLSELAVRLWFPANYINYIFFAGVVLEAIAVINSERGDTLSEVVWHFNKPGEWARAVLVGGFGFYIAWEFYVLGEPSLGRTIIAAALCIWLVTHFVWRGKFG